MELYQCEWERISTHAHSTLSLNRYNKPKLLPVVADVSKLHKYLQAQALLLKEEMKVITWKKYAEFSKVCLAQVILFNRKRSGEAERVSLAEFQKAINADLELDEADMSSVLTKFEMQLVKTHTRIETTGKKGRMVPVVLTQDMLANIEFLVSQREAAGVSSDFLFAKSMRKGNGEIFSE